MEVELDTFFYFWHSSGGGCGYNTIFYIVNFKYVYNMFVWFIDSLIRRFINIITFRFNNIKCYNIYIINTYYIILYVSNIF